LGKKDMEISFQLEHRPKVLPLTEVVEETPTIKTFYVNSPEIASKSDPGQFLMLWIVGVDEIPIAVSKAKNDGTIGLTVEKVGDATSKLHELQKGDLIGIRGPYGNTFDIPDDNLLIVGGGCGMGPLIFATERAVQKGKQVTVVLAAETEEDLLFKSRLEELGVNLILSTEDGSVGIKGLATDALKKTDLEWDFDSCLVCGPERMMAAIAETIEEKDIPVQLSLNRHVKCGIGICGQCTLDPSGLRVCEDGPVFFYEEINDGEFGDYKRDSAGRKMKI